MLEQTIQSLHERIKDSRLKDILTEELSDLLASKPDGVRTDEYMTAAAILVLRELKNTVMESDEHSSFCPSESHSPSGLDCETIIKGLLIGMHHDLLESNLQMVKALGSAISERDYGTSEHNFRVTLYAVSLAEQLNLNRENIQALIKGSFLHDLGKIGIRDKTLLKPGGLTAPEYDDVKRHVVMGKRIIASVKWLKDAVDVILHHHEKWDGTGYPEELSGEEIPLLARIFTVADVFDALTSQRPYKAAMSFAEATIAMAQEEDTRFDPDILREFLKIAANVYQHIIASDAHQLEDAVLSRINHYFQFSPTIDDLRDAFGSITRRGQRSDE